MINIDFSGVDAFISAIEIEQKRVNISVTDSYRSWVRAIFYDIVELSPQWSGNLAANWNISTSSVEGPEQTIPAKAEMWPLGQFAEPHHRGDPEAVGISKARFDAAVFGYSDQIYIYNPTEIAPEVEAHSIYIRGVNLLDGRVAMIAHAQALYGTFNPLQ